MCHETEGPYHMDQCWTSVPGAGAGGLTGGLTGGLEGAVGLDLGRVCPV
jgi:hypothetical protein